MSAKPESDKTAFTNPDAHSDLTAVPKAVVSMVPCTPPRLMKLFLVNMNKEEGEEEFGQDQE